MDFDSVCHPAATSPVVAGIRGIPSSRLHPFPITKMRQDPCLPPPSPAFPCFHCRQLSRIANLVQMLSMRAGGSINGREKPESDRHGSPGKSSCFFRRCSLGYWQRCPLKRHRSDCAVEGVLPNEFIPFRHICVVRSFGVFVGVVVLGEHGLPASGFFRD